jgi:hypothetical protein
VSATERREHMSWFSKSLEKRYDLPGMDPTDREILQAIKSDLAGTGIVGGVLGSLFTKAEDQAKIGLLSAIVKQNWLILRKLGQLK